MECQDTKHVLPSRLLLWWCSAAVLAWTLLAAL